MEFSLQVSERSDEISDISDEFSASLGEISKILARPCPK
jgi:hypothetical protein